MTDMTPLVRAKVDSTLLHAGLPFFPTSSLHMRRPELKRVVPCPALPLAGNARREQLPETPDITKHMTL